MAMTEFRVFKTERPSHRPLNCKGQIQMNQPNNLITTIKALVKNISLRTSRGRGKTLSMHTHFHLLLFKYKSNPAKTYQFLLTKRQLPAQITQNRGKLNQKAAYKGILKEVKR